MGVRTNGSAGRHPGKVRTGRKQSGAWNNSAETHNGFRRQSWKGTRSYSEMADKKLS